jgi:large subunit ribosomal protein L16
MFELEGIPKDAAKLAMRLGASKLPIRTRFVERVELGGE